MPAPLNHSFDREKTPSAVDKSAERDAKKKEIKKIKEATKAQQEKTEKKNMLAYKHQALHEMNQRQREVNKFMKKIDKEKLKQNPVKKMTYSELKQRSNEIDLNIKMGLYSIKEE
jgi:hypothetical protein